MERLFKLLSSYTDKKDISLDSNLKNDLLLDSILIISLILEIEEEFEIEIPDEKLTEENFESPKSLMLIIDEQIKNKKGYMENYEI